MEECGPCPNFASYLTEHLNLNVLQITSFPYNKNQQDALFLKFILV